MFAIFACVVAAFVGGQNAPPVDRGAAQNFVGSTVANTIVDAIEPTTRYIIVAEDHDVDAHRIFSADLLASISGRRSVVVGLEAARSHYILNPEDVVRSGYLLSDGFNYFFQTAISATIPIFGYDTSHKNYMNDSELAARGLSTRYPNPRDRKSAETIVALTEHSTAELVFLHVGFSHASERWWQNQDGSRGWLAAQLNMLTGTDALTVRLFRGRDLDWYSSRGRLQTDKGRCDLIPEVVTVLQYGRGWMGCIPKSRVQSAHYTDFIVLITDP